MSGDGFGMGGTHGRDRQPGEPAPAPAQDTFLYGCKTGQFRTFYNSLVLYIIVTDLKIVYFVKKTGASGGYFLPRLSLSAPRPRGGHRGWVCQAGAITGVPASTRRGRGTPPLQPLISSLISTSGSAGSRSWPPARDVTGRHPAGFISWGWDALPRACPGLEMWHGGAEDAASPKWGWSWHRADGLLLTELKNTPWIKKKKKYTINANIHPKCKSTP